MRLAHYCSSDFELINFNPRTREECDITLPKICTGNSYFNPRTREECDTRIFGRTDSWLYFNPRTREECDDKSRLLYRLLQEFQSTHSRGVRLVLFSFVFYKLIISIHALARSATGSLLNSTAPLPKFQSTHSRGVRPKTVAPSSLVAVFQSTHSRGVRHCDT